MKKIKIYLYIGIMSFCTSCSDFLDKVPDERTQIDSPDKVSALLVNAYPKVSYAAIVNTRCDYITDFGSVYSGAQPGALFSFMGEYFLWKMEMIPSKTSGQDAMQLLQYLTRRLFLSTS